MKNFRAYDGFDIVDALATCRPNWTILRAVRKNRTTGMDISTVLVNALGLAATTTSVLLWLPQARTTWHNRNDPVRLNGVSGATQWLLVVSSLLWGSYGLLIQSVWVSAPNVVSMTVAVTSIVILRRGRSLPPTTKSIPIITVDEPMSAWATFPGSTPAEPMFAAPSWADQKTETTPIILAGHPADTAEMSPGFTHPTTGTLPAFL